MVLNRLGQFRPGQAQPLVTHHECFTLGKLGDRGIERRAYGHGEQVFVLAPAGVALVFHNLPFLCLCGIDH
ncbi:hypothetical protein D3C84_537250 [compost metagenome]